MKPETIRKMLVNQMLLSFGTMFASQVGDAIVGLVCKCSLLITLKSTECCHLVSPFSQDSRGMLSFLGLVDQCLKAGKRQAWRAASVTNICVGLLAGLKVTF